MPCASEIQQSIVSYHELALQRKSYSPCQHDWIAIRMSHECFVPNYSVGEKKKHPKILII